MRNHLIALAKSFIERWDEFADNEKVSKRFGFNFIARQTEYDGMTVTVAKSTVIGMTPDHLRRYNERICEI